MACANACRFYGIKEQAETIALRIRIAAERDLFFEIMELAQFLGCQGHVARQQFVGVERQAFAVVPAYAMGDNGPHNRWVSKLLKYPRSYITCFRHSRRSSQFLLPITCT